MQDAYLFIIVISWLICLPQSLKGYTTFFMLILTEHEIYHAHKC